MVLLSDRYELGATIGAGGMARVVQAHDRLLDRPVAVKLMRDDLSADPTVRQRFLREARAAARFAHPNAVAVYDTGQDGRRPWIVMELVDGDNLADRLAAEGALPAETAKAITDQVLAALSAAHRAGMVHRDVKPANILLPDRGGVKLTDFGIAKGIQEATAGLTATGQLIGTAKYLAPEQVDGHPATPASDIYAMGVVLYEMLAGAPPFSGENALAVALAHTRDPVPPLRGVDPTLASVAQRALAKDPAGRYPDAAAMREALGGDSRPAPVAPVAAAAATVPLRDPSAAATVPDRERNRPPWLLIGVVVLALLGLLAFAADSLMDGTTGGQAGQRSQRQSRQGGEVPIAPGSASEAQQTEPAQTEPEQTEPEQTEPEQTEPEQVEPAQTEPQEPPTPTSLAELIALLDADDGAYGEKQPDLVDKLTDLLGKSEDERPKEAAKLQEEIGEWVANGELDAEIAALAVRRLEPLAAQRPAEDDGDDDDDEGERRGRGQRRRG
jgi:serine/threonine-protein kinase